jgi:hypothetical protein
MQEVVDTPPTDFKDEKIEYDLQDGSTDEQVVVNQEIPHHPEEYQFTWRSAITGSLLGCLVGRDLFFFFSNQSIIASIY